MEVGRTTSYLEMSIRRDSCSHQDFLKISVVKRWLERRLRLRISRVSKEDRERALVK